MSINNKRKPFDDVRVRRALAHAIDRKAFIDGALEGLAKPIGSHLAPTDAGYVDLTGMYPYDPEKAKALLKEAGVATPLNVTLTLPPPQYARKGGEVVAAQLAKVGVIAKIENVEWAQWLGGTFKGNFDLTIINHVEPLDYITAYADPKYYFGYDSKAFRELAAKHAATDQPGRARPSCSATSSACWPPTRSTPTSSTAAQVAVAQARAEGAVGEFADLRQRHGGGELDRTRQ